MLYCFDCRFFCPDGGKELTEEGWNEALPGECRRHPPVVGDLIERPSGEELRCFREFPRVMAAEWCGEYVAREKRGAADGPPSENPQEETR